MALQNQIFSIQDEADFTAAALEVFAYQYENCKVYRQYADMLHCEPAKITAVEQIPFLPIEFFKTQRIIAEGKTPQICFTSSGTTGNETSTHFVADTTLYEESFLRCFRQFVGNPKDYAILALLPSYLEQGNSSLVYMLNELIVQSGNPDSGFYLYNFNKFADKIKLLDARNKKILVFGVGFALLEVAEQYQFNCKKLTVFETGGMKGRRKEISREELHQKLRVGFGVQTIYSEYGMTEMLSQAYTAVAPPPPFQDRFPLYSPDEENNVPLFIYPFCSGQNTIRRKFFAVLSAVCRQPERLCYFGVAALVLGTGKFFFSIYAKRTDCAKRKSGQRFLFI